MGEKQKNEENQDKKLQKWAAISTVLMLFITVVFGIINLIMDKKPIEVDDESANNILIVDTTKDTKIIGDVEVKDVDGGVTINPQNEVVDSSIHEEKNISITVIDSGIGINNGTIEGDTYNNIYNDNRTENTFVQKSTDFIYRGDIETLLNRAGNAFKRGEIDLTFEILSNEKLRDNKTVLLDIGYIYMDGGSLEGEQLDLAQEYFMEADCAEADRLLLALYLKENYSNDVVSQILGKLLWIRDDQQTWDYIANILDSKSWEEYVAENNASKDTFIFDTSILYEWEYVDQWWPGDIPPLATYDSRWIFQGTNNSGTTPYNIYREQRRKFMRNLYDFQGFYIEKEGVLIRLD